MIWTALGHAHPCSLAVKKGIPVSRMKLTLLGSVMAFGLAPQAVAQDGTIIYADSDRYEVVLDQPTTTQFKPLRDMGDEPALESLPEAQPE